MTYNGNIIQAYYSASNGGQTELTGNVWASDLPYYVQQDDAYDLANPSSLEEESFIPSEFNGDTLPLMDALVLQILQQGADEAAGEAVTLVSTVRVKARDAIYDPPSRCYTKADVTLMVATSDGTTGQLIVTIVFDDLIYAEDNPEGFFNTKRTKMRMRGAEPGFFEAENGATYDGWFLTNRRWGHGVGMSQRGAQQRATDGQTFTEILAFYYAGTELTTIGTFASAPALTSDTCACRRLLSAVLRPAHPGGTAFQAFLGGRNPVRDLVRRRGKDGRADIDGRFRTDGIRRRQFVFRSCGGGVRRYGRRRPDRAERP